MNHFSLVLDVTPRPGIHVYAPGAEGYRVISLALEYQACDDKVCDNPVSVPLSWTCRSDRESNASQRTRSSARTLAAPRSLASNRNRRRHAKEAFAKAQLVGDREDRLHH